MNQILSDKKNIIIIVLIITTFTFAILNVFNYTKAAKYKEESIHFSDKDSLQATINALSNENVELKRKLQGMTQVEEMTYTNYDPAIKIIKALYESNENNNNLAVKIESVKDYMTDKVYRSLMPEEEHATGNSGVEYSSTINIDRIYSYSVNETTQSIAAVCTHKMKVMNNPASSTTLIIIMDLSFENDIWKVENILFEESFAQTIF